MEGDTMKRAKRGVDPTDDDRILAVADLTGRTGAKTLEMGHVPAGWWAAALYQGGRITVEGQHCPPEAAEALAVRLLTGAKCMGCGGLVSLDGIGGWIGSEQHMTNGESFTVRDAMDKGICHWKRTGKRWGSECGQ